MKKILTVFLLLFSAHALADSTLSSYFDGKQACFILFDVNKDVVIEKYNTPRCSQQISPNSTFKIALSLMAFDQKLIDQKTIFKWDGKTRTLPNWNQDQTPQTWLKNSVVWVSRVITPQLGIDKINHYLHQFNYGNEDFSGDPGKNNALTQAWLNSSLKISANEQLEFLKKLITDHLPVSKMAMMETKSNMYLETLPNDWKLYGKTGSSGDLNALQNGWFVGFIQKANQTYIVILNFSDLQKPNDAEFAGLRAKKIAKEILGKENLLSRK